MYVYVDIKANQMTKINRRKEVHNKNSPILGGVTLMENFLFSLLLPKDLKSLSRKLTGIMFVSFFTDFQTESACPDKRRHRAQAIRIIQILRRCLELNISLKRIPLPNNQTKQEHEFTVQNYSSSEKRFFSIYSYLGEVE